MPGNVRVSGTWREVSDVSVRVGGTWRTVQDGFTRVAGVWRQWYANIKDNYILTSSDSTFTPNVDVWIWDNGFGSRFANPTSFSDFPRSSRFAYDLSAIAVTGSATPIVQVWAFSSSGWGTKFADAASSTGRTGNAVDWRPNMNAIYVGSNGTPFMEGWAWSSSGFGSKFANPGTLPASQAGVHRGIKVRANGNRVAYGQSSGTVLATYDLLTGGGFSTRRTATTVSGANVVTWSHNSNFLAAEDGNSSSQRWGVYNYATTFGTRLQPPTFTDSQVGGLNFDRTNSFLAVSGVNSGEVAAWPVSSSAIGTKLATAVFPGGSGYDVEFTPTNTALVVAHSNNPRVSGYAWSSSGIGSKFANPAVLPTFTPKAISVV